MGWTILLLVCNLCFLRVWECWATWLSCHAVIVMPISKGDVYTGKKDGHVEKGRGAKCCEESDLSPTSIRGTIWYTIPSLSNFTLFWVLLHVFRVSFSVFSKSATCIQSKSRQRSTLLRAVDVMSKVHPHVGIVTSDVGVRSDSLQHLHLGLFLHGYLFLLVYTSSFRDKACFDAQT